MSGNNTQNTGLFSSPDNGTSFDQVAALTSVGLPDGTVPELDASDLSSTGKEYIPGLIDEGSVNFSVNFDGNDSSHQQLMADKSAGTTKPWKIRVPDKQGTFTDVVFDGYVSSFGGDFNVDQVQQLSGTIRVSGSVTITHGVAA